MGQVFSRCFGFASREALETFDTPGPGGARELDEDDAPFHTLTGSGGLHEAGAHRAASGSGGLHEAGAHRAASGSCGLHEAGAHRTASGSGNADGPRETGRNYGAQGWTIDPLKQVDLLLLGKTGNGKSATGNSILRRRAFKSMSNTSSVTSRVTAEESDYFGTVIKVVDGPGVGDTRLDDEDGKKLVMGQMQTAIALNDRGYHAFLLVARYGVRFTKEDENALSLLRSTFGPDFIRNVCILILTCGDNFENDHDYKGQTIDKWCQAQSGFFKSVYDECQGRVILFDNSTKDVEKQEAQLDNLLRMVHTLDLRGNRYRSEHFEKAAEARHKALIEARIPKIQEEAMTKLTVISQTFENIVKLGRRKRDPKALGVLIKECNTLYQNIKKEDAETGALNSLMEAIKAEEANAEKQETEDRIRQLENQLAKVKRSHERLLEQNKDESSCSIL